MPLDKFLDERRLSNPRVATDQHDASIPCDYAFKNDLQLIEE